MIIIGDPYDMSELERRTALAVLAEHILAVLQDSGPLTPPTILYLLRRRRSVEVKRDTLNFTVAHMIKQGLLKEIQIRKEDRSGIHHITHYMQPEDISRIPQYPPVAFDYTEAYHHLLMRYRAIREHPELATAAEDYIDALYNPEPIDIEHKIY